jgi:hypothetical protein
MVRTKMNPYAEPLDRAKWSRLSQEEIDQVARELQSERPAADRYTLLHILGRAGAVTQRSLVERFLHSVDDPMLAQMALHILCNYWDMPGQYLDDLIRFVRGVSWDTDGDVRFTALADAGEYLRLHEEPRLLREVLHVFEDAAEAQGVREAAYVALARAMGRDWQALPSAARHFDLERAIDPAILSEAKRRLAPYVSLPTT